MAIFVETNKGIRTPHGVNGHDCRGSGCANWNGSCCYDMVAEAKENNCSVDDIVNKNKCSYYESQNDCESEDD